MNTAEVTNVLSKRKKRRSKKKYAELLEVTEGSSSERKASISKLKPKHLSELVHNPNITLSQLHTLKSPTSKNDNIINNSSLVVYDPNDIDAECNFDEGEAVLFEGLETLDTNKTLTLDDSDFLQKLESVTNMDSQQKFIDDFEQELDDNLPTMSASYEESNFQVQPYPTVKASAPHSVREKEEHGPSVKTSYKRDLREKLAKIKLSELESAGREESLYHNTHCYIEVCVRCNMLNRALAALESYRYKHKNKKRIHKNAITLYNSVLQGFSEKGHLNKVNDIMGMLREDKVPFTVETFAACLECIGRMPDDDSSRQRLKVVIEEMNKCGFSLQNIFAESVFIRNQREKILDAVRRIEADFIPNVPLPNTSYTCSLLEDLNSTENKVFKSPAEGILDTEQLKELIKEQFQLEISNNVKVKTIEDRKESGPAIQYYREKLENSQESWRVAIREAFERDMHALRSRNHTFKAYRNVNLYPFLKILEPEQYVDIIMQEIRKLAEGSETFSPTMVTLHKELAQHVRARYIIKQKQKNGVLSKVEHLYNKYCDWYLAPGSTNIRNTREKWQHLLHENQDGPSVNVADKYWTHNVLNGIGKFLYNIILNDIKIDVNIVKSNCKTPHYLPAFYSLFRYHGRLLKEEVKPHPVLSRLFRGAAQPDLVFDVATVPMLCPPLPWTSVSSGGYLVAKTNFMRFAQEACQQMQRLEESSKQQLYPAFDSLNQLASIPWTVNKPVLDIVIEVFNKGGQKKLDIPEPPSACPPPDKLTPQMTKLERYNVYRKRMALRRQKAEMYSLWCDSLYRLSLANHFRDKVFWLPHNLDFRGRVYPCPPHLNHLGSDMARSLLQFAKGEPLGPDGLKWLKIHLVNLTGLKKKNSLQERFEFAEEMMPEILDSADNPLTGRMWWAESEEPWQTLACCLEIARVVRCKDPEKYICHFPVHQDGSCNGLQHYAALGRDTAGAQSVNLSPAERPQDVYECVAQLVERERSKDAHNGVKIAQVLDGFVRRKVIKQTVMTTVYGVTRFGARLQIARQLKDLDDFPKDCVWPASSYLVAKTFESLREMFTSTKEIQDWFTECARLIAQTCGQNVEWVTPLGLPVVQPYFRPLKALKFKTSEIHDHFSVDMFERPNVMKQKNAFPPNFIHSLDSSHMMLTSLFCERSNITFVSVHDCYWTHPCTVDVMNKICREQFVALHSQPILESLSMFLVKKYGYRARDIGREGSVLDSAKQKLNRTLRQVPRKGDFNLQNVLESVYFFS